METAGRTMVNQMDWTDLSTCRKCGCNPGMGARRGWAYDGFVYCSNCLVVRDAQLDKQYKEEKAKREKGKGCG